MKKGLKEHMWEVLQDLVLGHGAQTGLQLACLTSQLL